VGVPGSRGRTLVELARAVCDGRLSLEPHGDPEVTIAGLKALPGIGDWTAQYLAMRALGWPDAFPEGDLGLRKALGGVPPREMLRMAEPWRPWRAYAAMHLWKTLENPK
jgi:AraC family transcriptional regulator of adaptative response / DNA-3-methyladenine glycosylase II